MQCLAGKIAGAKWEGSKTTFDDDASHNLGKIPDITLQMADTEAAEQSSHPTSQLKLPKMKWKKMATLELQKVSCGMHTSGCDCESGYSP